MRSRWGQKQLSRVATTQKSRDSSFLCILKASQGQIIPTCAAFVVLVGITMGDVNGNHGVACAPAGRSINTSSFVETGRNDVGGLCVGAVPSLRTSFFVIMQPRA